MNIVIANSSMNEVIAWISGGDISLEPILDVLIVVFIIYVIPPKFIV